MFLPATYQAALLLMLLSMICWGSWANTLKLCQGYRFQLFYWDYALGVVLGALVLGLTAGSHGSAGPPFLSDIVETPLESMKMAVSWRSGLQHC
jgi:glucose uptake protein